MLCDGETENHCTECAQVLCGDDDCETERDDGIVMCDECAVKYMMDRARWRLYDLLIVVAGHAAANWSPDALGIMLRAAATRGLPYEAHKRATIV